VSHNKEPEIVLGAVGSLTNRPPLAAEEPFNSIILSPIDTVVESIAVVVPFTSKLPLTVRFDPVVSIAVFNDAVYKFIPSEDNPSETPETNRLSAYTARNVPETAPKSIIDPDGTVEVSIWVQFICCNAM
jgi:hypothetical protein